MANDVSAVIAGILVLPAARKAGYSFEDVKFLVKNPPAKPRFALSNAETRICALAGRTSVDIDDSQVLWPTIFLGLSI